MRAQLRRLRFRSWPFSSIGSDPQGRVPTPSAPSKPSASLPQVDDLKAKLATQEVEVRHKNEDADKLIRVVGIETDKVSREKAIADEEERKVALIMQEVKQKQKDCEDDLAKAEPALTAAQAALNTLNKVGRSSVPTARPSRGQGEALPTQRQRGTLVSQRGTRAKLEGSGWDPAVTGLFIMPPFIETACVPGSADDQ